MFVVGELISSSPRAQPGRVGLILETKFEKLNQYCKILWMDKDEPEWYYSGGLHEVAHKYTSKIKGS